MSILKEYHCLSQKSHIAHREKEKLKDQIRCKINNLLDYDDLIIKPYVTEIYLSEKISYSKLTMIKNELEPINITMQPVLTTNNSRILLELDY